MYHKILVAYDGSPDSRRALDHAIALAQDQNARLVVVTVVAPVSGALLMAGQGTLVAEQHAAYETYLREACDAVPADLPVTTVLREGPAASQLLEVVRESGCDIVVMGTHGRGRLGEALLGSVSRAVVHEAEVPVLLLRDRSARP